MSRADGNFDPIEAVRAFLEEARCDSQIKRTEATIFTVSDASAAVGAPEEEILKSILLRVNHGKSYALALMSGVNKVDTKKVKRALGASHVSFAGVEARRLVIALERAGVSVGTGSACAASRMRVSHVLEAIGMPRELAEGSLRLTLGRGTTEEDVDYAAGSIADAVRAEMARVGMDDAAMAALAGGWGRR